MSFAQEKVKREQLPQPVQQKLSESSGQGEVKEITKRSQNGRTVFEVQMEKQGRTERLTIAENGEIVNRSSASASATGATASSSARTTSSEPTTRTYGTTTTGQQSSNSSVASTQRQSTGQSSSAQSQPEQNRQANEPDAVVTGVAVVETYTLRPIDTESMIPKAQLPQAVQQTIDREAPGREIADIDRETHDGRTVYEVEFRDSNVNPQIHITEDGKLVEGGGPASEAWQSVRNFFAGTQVKDTPQAVQETIRREAKDGTITDVDIERRTGDRVYEVEIEDSRGQYEIHIAENGRVIANERNERSMAATTSTSRPEDVRVGDAAVARRDTLHPIDTESMIRKEQLPQAVQQAIEREAPGREIADIDREMHNGQTVYEVEFRDSNLNPQLHFSENGEVIEGTGPVDEAVQSVRNFFAGTQVRDTPQAVQDTIKREARNGTVTDIDIERRTGERVYEVEIEDSQGDYEIHIAEDGRVLRNERAVAE